MQIKYYRHLNKFTHFLYIQENGEGKTGLADARLSIWEADSAGNKLINIVLNQVMSEVNAITHPGWYEWDQGTPYFSFDQDYIVEYGIESYFLGQSRDIEHYIIEQITAAVQQMYGTVSLQNTDSFSKGYQMIAVPMATGYWDPSQFVAEIKSGTIVGSNVTIDSACSFTVEVGDRIKIRDGGAGNDWETSVITNIIGDPYTPTEFTVAVPFSTDQTISVLVYKPWSGFIFDTTVSKIANCVLDQLCSIYECWRNATDTGWQLNGGVYSDYNNDNARNLAYNNIGETGNNTRSLFEFVSVINTIIGGEDFLWQVAPGAWWNASHWADDEVNFPLIHDTGVIIPDGEEVTAMIAVTMDDEWELFFDWGEKP